jgi:indole-3-glycerol phosphate synthase
MSTVLDTIIDGVRLDLSARQAVVTQADLERLADQAPPALDGHAALSMPGLSRDRRGQAREPEQGRPRADIPDPAALAATYAESGGAAVISVLTEERRFGGSLADLDAVREAVDHPGPAQGLHGRRLPDLGGPRPRRRPRPAHRGRVDGCRVGAPCITSPASSA